LANQYLPASLVPLKLKATFTSLDTVTKLEVDTMSSLPVNNKPCPLFRLPLELREVVYGWVQGGPHVKIAVPFLLGPHPFFAGNALLHINKQIFNEYTNLILSTSEIVLDFMSHDFTPRESNILRTAHKMTIQSKIAPVCGSNGYNSKYRGKAVLPKHPGRELKPWVDELVRNPAITHLTVIVTQSVLFRCKKHGNWNEDCDHVRLFKKASKVLGRVTVRDFVEVVWDAHGWKIGKWCAEMGRLWVRKLEEKIMSKREVGVKEKQGEVKGD